MKHPIIISALVLIVLAALPGRARATLVNSNSIIKDNIEYYMQTDKALYNLGEDVEMLYRVTNLGVVDVNFDFFSGPVDDRCDYMVEKDGERIWDNLFRPYETVLTSFTLSPQESYVYTHTWDMMNNNGTPWLPDDDFLISPGSYNVIGALPYSTIGDEGEYEYRCVPVSVTINVVPEPATLLLLGLGGLMLRKRRV